MVLNQNIQAKWNQHRTDHILIRTKPKELRVFFLFLFLISMNVFFSFSLSLFFFFFLLITRQRHCKRGKAEKEISLINSWVILSWIQFNFLNTKTSLDHYHHHHHRKIIVQLLMKSEYHESLWWTTHRSRWLLIDRRCVFLSLSLFPICSKRTNKTKKKKKEKRRKNPCSL